MSRRASGTCALGRARAPGARGAARALPPRGGLRLPGGRGALARSTGAPRRRRARARWSRCGPVGAALGAPARGARRVAGVRGRVVPQGQGDVGASFLDRDGLALGQHVWLPHAHQRAKARVVILEQELALSERNLRVKPRDGDVVHPEASLLGAAAEGQRAVPRERGDEDASTPAGSARSRRLLEHHEGPGWLRHLHQGPLDALQAHVRGERLLAQVAVLLLHEVGVSSLLVHQAHPAADPLLQAPQVHALDGASAAARPDQRALLVTVAVQADAAEAALCPRALVVLAGSLSVWQSQFWLHSSARVGHQLADAEPRAAHADLVPLRQLVRGTGEVLDDQPQLLARRARPRVRAVDPEGAVLLTELQQRLAVGGHGLAPFERHQRPAHPGDLRRPGQIEVPGPGAGRLEVEQVPRVGGPQSGLDLHRRLALRGAHGLQATARAVLTKWAGRGDANLDGQS
mmetsp:Transcript_91911/g.259848  ORF Transcript_91911/g.259848 Transcript_91911/m.259848 type:complete len:461 (+) Transcript_91911:81-1463(+)